MKHGGFTRRRLLLALVVCAIIAIAALLVPANWPGETGDPAPKADLIVVLGGSTADRSAFALDLYRKGVAPRLIISGDDSEILMRLRESGVEDAVMIHENRAHSTWENGVFCKPIIEGLEVRNVILVTSWYHAGRSRAVFNHLLPDHHFTIACGEMPDPLRQEDRALVLRERLAMLYYLVRYGVWCF